MRSGLASSMAALVWLGATGAALAAEVKGTSRIESVTVFPQGAEVVRTTKVKLEAGEHAILLADLPGQAVASSIRVEGRATGRLEIGSVDVRRLMVTSGDPAVANSQRRKLEDEIERLKDQRVEQDNAVKAAEAQRAFLDNLAKLPSTPVPAGAGAPREDWAAIFAVIGQRSAEAGKAIGEARIKQREIDKKIADLQKEIAATAPQQVERTEARINVTASAPLEATLTVLYQVGNANWLAFYDARLATGDKATAPKLQVARRASITNSSGEDWDEVALKLSTTRPGRATAAPELHMLSVDYVPEPRPAPMAAPAPSGGVADGRLRSAAPPPPAMPAEAAAEAAKPKLEAVTETASAATIGAFQSVFDIAGRVTVKSSPEIKRVQIAVEDIEPQLIVRTVPRFDETAYLYARISAPKAAAPFLPGQVSLFRDGVFVGNGRLPQLAPGEDHELGFGPDERVKIKRVVREDKKGETGTFTTSKVEERNFTINVKSLHGRPVQVHVIDRHPVSMHQDIKVEFTARGVQPTRRDVNDRRGTFVWELAVNPDEEKQLAFGYRVTYPGDKRIQYREMSPEQIREGTQHRL